MPPWAAHGVEAWAESTRVLLPLGVWGWRNQGGGGAGMAQGSHRDISCGAWQKDAQVVHPSAQTLCLCPVCHGLESWLWAVWTQWRSPGTTIRLSLSKHVVFRCVL